MRLMFEREESIPAAASAAERSERDTMFEREDSVPAAASAAERSELAGAASVGGRGIPARSERDKETQ
jgi:hypothetical protein